MSRSDFQSAKIWEWDDFENDPICVDVRAGLAHRVLLNEHHDVGVDPVIAHSYLMGIKTLADHMDVSPGSGVPFLFLVRHLAELCLKDALHALVKAYGEPSGGIPKGHELSKLIGAIDSYVSGANGLVQNDDCDVLGGDGYRRAKEVSINLGMIDPKSFKFRYSTDRDGNPHDGRREFVFEPSYTYRVMFNFYGFWSSFSQNVGVLGGWIDP